MPFSSSLSPSPCFFGCTFPCLQSLPFFIPISHIPNHRRSFRISAMADSNPYTKPHVTFPELNSPIRPKPINQGKSYSDFLLRSVFFALFIIVFPLFPSQAPDFINQTILNKFWELLHLLFIGIAVAYGLFSRRNVEADLEVETLSKSDTDSTPYYVSKVFPVSSIFGDGHEIPCGSDEKRMMHCWNQYLEGDPGVVCSNGSNVMDEHYKLQFPISEYNFADSVGFEGTNLVQAWNSEYYHSEPVVVVSQPYNTVGECGEVVGYKPLGLPVRSLRSIAGDLNSPNYNNESDSSSGSRASYKSSVKSGDRNFGDLGPSNLDKKFNDVAGSASPIPWRSTSRRLESEEKSGDVIRPSHFRPLSAAETKFQSLSSRSLRSTTSFSSHTSLYSSLDSNSSDNLNLQEEEVGHKKTFYGLSSESMNFQEEDFGKSKTSHGSSPRYGRMPTKEKYADVSCPSNFRPMSVDETQFESLGMQAFQSTGSFSSQTSLYSSLESVSSETMNLQKEELGENMCSRGSSSSSSPSPPSSSSPSPPARGNGKASLQVFHSPRYGRMPTKEKYADVSGPSHFRPMSVDETQFESLGKQSFQSTGSFSSQTSLYSSLESVSPETMNLQKEELGEKMGSHGSSSSGSLSPPVRGNGRASLQAFHSRGHSVGSFLQDDMKKNLKDDLRGLNGIQGKDPSGNKESGQQSLQPETEKPAGLAKAPLKGKSVRTRRASRLTSETIKAGEKCGKKTDENIEKMNDNVEEVLMKNGGPDHLLKGIRRQDMDTASLKPEATFSKYHKRGKQELSKNVSKEDSDIELDSFKVNSDEDAVSENVNDSGLDSEVDKKASEFIAKFKAQIRLQKMASIDRSRGQ